MSESVDSASPPNIEQSAAIEWAAGPLRIMAGAGAGKTFTLTQSVVSLIERDLATPSQILALTFTNRATEQLRERITAALLKLPGQSEQVDIDTYHAFGGRIVSEHGHLLGLPPDPLMLTPAESWITLWRSLDKIDFTSLELANLRDRQHSPLGKIVSLGSRLRDELRDLDDLAALIDDPGVETSEDMRDYLSALRVYEAAKRDQGGIDYGDQIALACELLEREDVLAVYRNRYRYMLVDEYQDTNFAQSVMVRLLGSAIGANVRVVGDPNQAIYGFRGASPDNLERFAIKDFPEAHTLPLQKNYRSTGAILAAANAIWEGDPGPYRGNLEAASDEPPIRPALVFGAAFTDEVAWIAGEINRLFAAGYRHRDIAVIVRKNAVKRRISTGLQDHRIPAQPIGGSSLYEAQEVRLIISALRVIGDPLDDSALAHLLSADRWGIDERALYQLALVRQTREPLLAATQRIAYESSAEEWADLRDCLYEIDRLVSRSYRASLPRLVDDVIETIGSGQTVIEEANSQRFRAVVQQFAESRVGTPGLPELLAYLDLLLTAGGDDEAMTETDLGDADTVKVLTAHSAKGLEWPVVFVATVNKQDFWLNQHRDELPRELLRPVAGMPLRSDFLPDVKGDKSFERAYMDWKKAQHVLEERRTLYVALTRPQELLYLTWSETLLSRKRPTTLSDLLAPVVQHCDEIVAPPADTGLGVDSLGEIAREVIPAFTQLLADPTVDATALGEQFAAAWGANGGDRAMAAQAFSAFAEERGLLARQVATLRAIESITPADDGVAAGRDGPISYSQLDTFKHCPHRYYLRHVVGLPGLPQSWAAQFGTSFHEAIALEARARRRGEAVSAESVRGWIAAGAHGTGNPGGEAPSTVDPVTVYLQSVDCRAEPLLIEEAFALRLDDVVLNGIIDRVHRLPDGDVEIVDYKTDRQARTEQQVREGLQLQIYALACQEAFPEIQPAPTRAAMFFVRTGDRVETRFSPADLAVARDEIQSRARKMRAVGPDEHLASEQTCRWCEYRLTCRHAIRGGTPT